jgi:organic radical activating enzyme
MSATKPDVFVSFTKVDQDLAHKVYSYLDSQGLSVFFSPVSLEQDGVAEFPSAIDAALQAAKVLVAVGTSAENLRSDWVNTECSRFHAFGRTKPNRMFYYVDKVEFKALPTLFGQVQAFQDGPDSLEHLYQFIIGGSSPPPLLLAEWAVREAEKHPRLLAQLHELHDMVARAAGKRTEVVITLYARSSQRLEIGQFAYDLLYYRNLRDDAPMFGPIIQNDDRIAFVGTKDAREIAQVRTTDRKAGGFLDRENIVSRAKFKLAQGLWSAPPESRPNVDRNTILGLLFVNARAFPLDDEVFDTPEFHVMLSQIEQSVEEIKILRAAAHRSRVGGFLNLLNTLQYPNSPAGVNGFFSSHESDGVFKAIVGGETDFSFAAYLYLDQPRSLKWLWSNGPTSTPATLQLPPTADRESLLVEAVAMDPRHKPLLIHDLPAKAEYAGRVIRTKLGDTSQVNMVIPVLSRPVFQGADPVLLGVLDIQADRPRQFATDDVQLLYLLSETRIAHFFEGLLAARANGTLPLHNSEPYMPFEKSKLAFDVHDLRELNFNSMKFLLHWDKIRELVTTGITSAPATVEVWPTMVCNHSCVWCRTAWERNAYGFGPKDEMTREELLGIAHDLLAFPGIDILISGGGEPLKHPAIHEFMQAISNVDGTVGIFTNGTRPARFSFWENFFKRTDRHRFARLSFNGHDPESYFRVHFNRGIKDYPVLPPNHENQYADARKILVDLLGMRSPMASVAIGDTVMHRDLHLVEQKAKHAKGLGVDFIQMRPELKESSQKNKKGDDVCTTVLKNAIPYEHDKVFNVVHTDGERSFVRHDEHRCYAMQLVPTLVPDTENGWTRVMPCSYAINNWGETPDLGRMRVGAKLSEFWKRMNQKFTTGEAPSDPDYDVTIEHPIDPVAAQCPQCRYYRLNKRIQSIKDRVGEDRNKLRLIDQLVAQLNKDPQNLDPQLRQDVEALWADDPQYAIDIDEAKKAFQESQELKIVPSF